MSNSKKPSTLSLVKELDQRANLLKSGNYIHELDDKGLPNMPVPTSPEATIVCVPTREAPPPWDLVLRLVQNTPTAASFLYSVNAAQRSQAVALQLRYGLALHWLYKNKWHDKHRIPTWQGLKPGTQQAVAVFGGMLLKLMELCIQTHPVVSADAIPYRNAAEWFCAIALEIRDIDFESISDNALRGKYPLIQCYRKQLATLRDYKSPFDSSPHLDRLIKTAAPFAERNHKFCRDYWRPYLQSLAILVRDLEKNSAWVMVFEEGGNNYCHPKPGKQKLKV